MVPRPAAVLLGAAAVGVNAAPALAPRGFNHSCTSTVYYEPTCTSTAYYDPSCTSTVYYDPSATYTSTSYYTVTPTDGCVRDACYTAIGGSQSTQCPATSTTTTTSTNTQSTIVTVAPTNGAQTTVTLTTTATTTNTVTSTNTETSSATTTPTVTVTTTTFQAVLLPPASTTGSSDDDDDASAARRWTTMFAHTTAVDDSTPHPIFTDKPVQKRANEEISDVVTVYETYTVTNNGYTTSGYDDFFTNPNWKPDYATETSTVYNRANVDSPQPTVYVIEKVIAVVNPGSNPSSATIKKRNDASPSPSVIVVEKVIAIEHPNGAPSVTTKQKRDRAEMPTSTATASIAKHGRAKQHLPSCSCCALCSSSREPVTKCQTRTYCISTAGVATTTYTSAVTTINGPAPTCTDSAKLTSACSCRSKGGVATSTVHTTTTTSTSKATVTIKQAGTTTVTSTITATITTTTTTNTTTTTTSTASATTATATATQSSTTFKVRVNGANGNTAFDNTYIQVIRNDANTGAGSVPYPASQGTIFSIGQNSGFFTVNDASNPYNGYLAGTKRNSNDVYRTAVWQNGLNRFSACGLGDNNRVQCLDADGDTFFEICGNLLRQTAVAAGDAGCSRVTLTAVDPATS